MCPINGDIIMKISERKYKLYKANLVPLDESELNHINEIKNIITELMSPYEIIFPDLTIELSSSRIGLHVSKETREYLDTTTNIISVLKCINTEDGSTFQLLFLENEINHKILNVLVTFDMVSELFYNNIMKEVLSDMSNKEIHFKDIYKLKNDN